jgi:hypothetical protein
VASGKRVIDTLPTFGYFLLEDQTALPRAYLARPLCVAGPAESLLAVQARSFVRGKEAIVECDHPLPPSIGEIGEVISLASEPERVVLRVRATAPAVVVLNDAFYSGWQATVDGASTPVFAANHVVRAVAVERGTHDVIFRYRTPGQRAATCLTVVFLLGGLVASLRAAVFRRHASPPIRGHK